MDKYFYNQLIELRQDWMFYLKAVFVVKNQKLKKKIEKEMKNTEIKYQATKRILGLGW